MTDGPTRVVRDNAKHKLFVAVPVLKKNEGKVPALSAAGWTTPAEAMGWGQDLLKQAGRKFKLRTEVHEF